MEMSSTLAPDVDAGRGRESGIGGQDNPPDLPFIAEEDATSGQHTIP